MLAEGKTKQIWNYSEDEVLVLSKDRITAWNGIKGHDLEEKAAIATKTTSNIFTILNNAGKSHVTKRSHVVLNLLQLIPLGLFQE